jgi:transposase
MKRQPRFEAKFYYDLSLERLVPEGHLLRLIDHAVDFSFIRAHCRPFYSHTGRPSVDPVVLFKMLLIGYLHGIYRAVSRTPPAASLRCFDNG